MVDKPNPKYICIVLYSRALSLHNKSQGRARGAWAMSARAHTSRGALLHASSRPRNSDTHSIPRPTQFDATSHCLRHTQDVHHKCCTTLSECRMRSAARASKMERTYRTNAAFETPLQPSAWRIARHVFISLRVPHIACLVTSS